jgi:type IV secretory pathway VirB10-like protein
MNKPTQWMTCALIAVTLAAVISGCQKNEAAAPNTTTPPQATTPAETPQGTPSGDGQAAQPGQGGAAAPAPATPAAPVKLTPITYADVEKEIITNTAKAANVKTVYLPQQGAVDDKMDQVGTTGEGHMVIGYYKMQVTESSKEIKPSGTVESQKAVQLKIGKANWITAAGQPTLYLKLGDTYIAISSAKASTDEIQAVAETLVPMK